ncbi:MAG: tetratricopeptide repeat protein [Candidatus Zixiibacteriota bacterium]|jgi:uncharacterized protein YraI
MGRYLVVIILIAATAAFVGCGKKDKEGGPSPAGAPGETGGAPAVSEPAPETARVNAGPLNLRSDPGLTGSIVGRLSEGEKVAVVGKSDGAETIDGKTAYWYEVETIDNKRGWVFGGYLDIGGGGTPVATETGEPGGTPAEAPPATINVTRANVPNWKAGDYMIEGKHRAEGGNYGEALPYFKAATELSPQTGNYWFELGMALQELGRHGEAATAYERAVVLMPDNFWVHNNLGLACVKAGKPRRAVEVLEKALKLDPKGTTDKAAAKDIARRNLAAAYELNGQPDKATGLR